MRLIDADALKGPLELQRASYARIGATERAEAYENCLWEIAQAPTVATDTNVLGKWISVKDRLPEYRHVVLVYTPHHKNVWAVSMHEDGNWYIWSPSGRRELLDPDWHGPITHWMPLPEPPEEVKQNEQNSNIQRSTNIP